MWGGGGHPVSPTAHGPPPAKPFKLPPSLPPPSSPPLCRRHPQGFPDYYVLVGLEGGSGGHGVSTAGLTERYLQVGAGEGSGGALACAPFAGGRWVHS